MIPEVGVLCDLLWADPDKHVETYALNTTRQISVVYGRRAVKEFFNRHDLDLICRGHEVCEDGYEFWFDRRLVTLFSAPHYLNEFDNNGAFMQVNDALRCTMQVLKPVATTGRQSS